MVKARACLLGTMLWLLGTRLGTLALCGGARRGCLSWRRPFVWRFDELPVEHQEAALWWWSRQTMLLPLRHFLHVSIHNSISAAATPEQ